MLQQASRVEADSAEARWRRLRAECAQHLAAVTYLQALARGRLVRGRPLAAGRQLPDNDDDGQFSEAEADESEADDFF